MSLPWLKALLSLPNLLSLARVPLGGAFWLTIGPTAQRSRWAFVVMAAAAATDVLDGHLARRNTARARAAGLPVEADGGTGAWLDPICDKLFVALVLSAIIVHRRPSPALILLIVSRELIQLPLGMVYRFVPMLRRWLRYDFRASVLGKAATVAQFLAIGALILDDRSTPILAGLAFVVGVAALVDYLRRAVLIGRRRIAEDDAQGDTQNNARNNTKGAS
jgi:phosphatidylglycerophosphate synthase